MYGACGMFCQVATDNDVQISKDILMKTVRRWRHVKVSFNQLIKRRPLRQLPIVLNSQWAWRGSQHD